MQSSKRTTLILEHLEKREVPAIYHWTGGMNGNTWLTPANWLEKQIPGVNDTVVFGPGQNSVVLRNAMNQPVNADVKTMVIDPGYRGIIDLDGNTLTVVSNLIIRGGTIDGNWGILKVSNIANPVSVTWNGGQIEQCDFQIGTDGGVASTFTWTEGISTDSRVVLGRDLTTTIQAAPNPPTLIQMVASELKNYGLINQSGKMRFKNTNTVTTTVENYGEWKSNTDLLSDLGPVRLFPVFDNYYRFEVPNAVGSNVFLDFNNHFGALVTVRESATLELKGAGTHEGTFVTETDGLVNFEKTPNLPIADGLNILKQTAALLGTGTYDVRRGSNLRINPNAYITVNRILLNSDGAPGVAASKIDVQGRLSVTGMMTWESGTITGSWGSRLQITTGSYLELSGVQDKTLEWVILSIAGLMRWESGDINMTQLASIVVEPGGRFLLESDDTIGADGLIPIPVVSPTIYIQPGGLLQNGPNNTPTIEAVVWNIGGIVAWINRLITVNTLEQSDGSLVLTNATLQISNSCRINGGTVRLNTGNLVAQNGVNVASGVELSGSGVITSRITSGGAINSASSLDPYTVGNIEFESFATFTPDSNLVFDIAGTLPVTQYDVITFDGKNELTGLLTIALNGFTPSTSDLFTIIESVNGYAGTFSSVAAPTFTISSQTYTLVPNYNSTDVTLTVELVPGSPPTISGLSPSSGSTAGNQTVTITGTNFSAVQSVTFDGIPVLHYTVDSSTQITVLTPPHAAGAVTVTVTTAAGWANDIYTYTTGSVPSITSISTSSGYLPGRTLVTVNGSNFTGAYDVTFGGVSASYFTVVSDSQITAYAPAATTPGTVDIRVVNYAGTSSVVSADEYTYSQQSAPTLTSLGTSTGPTSGKTSVALTGTVFQNVIDVLFDGISVTDFTVNSTTSITATTPPHVAGEIDVVVVTEGGTSQAQRFTFAAVVAPAISGLSVTSAGAAGGTPITIVGTHFLGTQSVLFGTAPAAQFIILSDTAITAIAPPGVPGSVHVTVVTPSGTSQQTSADLFTYTSAATPTVTGLNITSGSTAGGSTITVTGTNFTGATSVLFGSVSATSFTVLSATTLTAVAPAQVAGTVHLTVTTPGGTSGTSSSDQFTYNAATAPSVTAATPGSGPALGGSAVILTGANFLGASSVKFGTLDAYFTVLSDDTILCYAPAGTASATVHITVTTPSGTSSTSSADEFSYSSVSIPAVTSLDVSTGANSGGTQVVITGTNLGSVYQVLFGGIPAANLIINSDTQITVVTPAHATGTYDVILESAAGSSLPGSASRFEFTLASVPSITGLSVSTGTTAGNTTVVITGTSFTSAFAVSFGAVAALSFTVDSSTQITAVAPAQAAGTVDVRVTTYSGTSAVTGDDEFTYTAASSPTVSSLGTTGGSAAGGTLVAINGSHFVGTQSVQFGSVDAVFTVLSDSLIIATAPSQSAGTVHVTVTTFAGTSSTSSSDQFSYSSVSTPTVAGLSSSSGSTAGGNTILIVGTYLSSTSSVAFGTINATDFSVLSDSLLSVVVPPGTGTPVVTVTTLGGTSSGMGPTYTYTNITASAPTVTEVGPNTGATTGGQSVLITGTDFYGTTGVLFGATAATSFTVISNTEIIAVAPSGSAGTVDIYVTTNNGTSSADSADEFTYLSVGVPTISSMGTSSGTTAGGTSVTITGTNFTGATAVLFGTVAAASFTVNSSTSITATTDAAYAGSVNVSVTTPSGTSTSTATYTYTAASNPTISSLGTSSGSTAGGTSVVITGTNFGGTVEVTFGGIQAASFTIDSSTQITAVTPSAIAGTIDVLVTTTAGTSTANSNSRYTFSAASVPTVTSLGTTTGSTAGGTSVVITGTNFLGVTNVLFGAYDATSFTIDSSTQITAIAPAQLAGTVYVSAVASIGNSVSSSYSEYTYTAASSPTISSLDVSSGTTAGGTTVVITGTNFTAATQVTFGDDAASFTVDSSTQITVTTPAHTAGAVNVVVTTTAGSSSASSYTYSAASTPSITSVSPNSGSASGGTVVAIIGANFLGTTDVVFGGISTWYQVLSDSLIITSAPGGTAGTVDIRVTTTAGTSSIVSADEFTYTSVTLPTITSLSSSSGSTAGGTAVTLTGTNLLDTLEVTIGGVQVDYTVLSATTLSLTTPPMAAGSYDVLVTIPGATSAPARFTYTPASAPTVTDLDVTTGSTVGGITVTITGTNFTGASSVLFGNVSAAFTIVSSTSIQAVVPTATNTGDVDVVVYTPTGSSAISNDDVFTYTAPSAPTLSSLSTTSGSTTGGLTVNLIGTNFLGATEVSFGSEIASFTLLSSTWITAYVPAQAAGAVSVTVTSPGGVSSGITFTYSAPSGPAVTGLTLSAGSTTGGEEILIVGSGFAAATAVKFGSSDALSYYVISDTAVRATSPGGSAGTVHVTVTTAAGTSSTSSADQFTLSAPSSPTVSSLATSSGSSSGGTTVMITGTNLSQTSQVRFGGFSAVFIVNNSTTITAVSPPQAAGTIHITVTTPAGTSSTSSSDEFTYSAASAPTITSVGPDAGPTAGGNSVLISGTGFLGSTAVTFGSNPALSFIVISDSAIFATAPAGSGTVDVHVTTTSGSSSTTSADEYDYRSTPTLSGISPGSDYATGGITVTLTGTNLLDTSAVYFDGVPATNIVVLSSTSVSVTVPAHAAGSVDVVVITPGGQSGTVSFTYNSATTVTWVGGSTGDWATGANWSGSSVPGASADVVIPSGVTVTHSGSGTDTVHSLTVSGTLQISNGSLTISGWASITTLSLQGGTLTFDGQTDLGSFTQFAGTITGAGTITISSSWGWYGGTMEGTGTTLLADGSSNIFGDVMSSSTLILNDRPLINHGSVTWQSSSTATLELNDTTFTNAADGEFEASGSGAFTLTGSTGVFLNAGAFSVADGGSVTVDSNVSFENSGSIDIDSTSDLALDTGTGSGTIAVSSGGALEFTGGYTLTSASTVTGSGAITISSGTATFSGAVTASSVTISSGATLAGVGSIIANVTNNGTLSVGGASGIGNLLITGNYTQGSTGTLVLQIGGTTAGTGFDRLQITGSATLNGTLTVSYVGGFSPSSSTTLALMTWGSYSGSFSTINKPTNTTAQYNSEDFSLVITVGGDGGLGEG